jgi:N-acetyl-anhydromuramyl-L-alanine amidase AmpD
VSDWIGNLLSSIVGQKMERQPDPLDWIDRRKFAAQSHHGHKVRRRPLSRVTGICLHQTACHMGERPERYDGMGAHMAITRMGKVIWLHDWTHRVIHGNGWNDGTIGIEIDGLYAGVEGDDSTVWNDPSTPHREHGMALTIHTVAVAQRTIRQICAEVPGIKALVAHRQSSRDRRNDPGSEIWSRIALPVSAELGLSDGGEGFKIGDGRAIPEAWDSRAKGVSY